MAEALTVNDNTGGLRLEEKDTFNEGIKNANP